MLLCASSAYSSIVMLSRTRRSPINLFRRLRHSRYGRAGVGRRAPERRCVLMGAWCDVGSRPDLRHRPRHRCAVATPASRPRRGIGGVRSATDVATSVSPADWANVVDDIGLRRPTTNQRRQLPTCRSSLVAARSQRVPRHGEHQRRGAGAGDGVATAMSHRRRVGDSAPWRQSSGVATSEQENTTRREQPAVDRSLVDCHHLRIQDLNVRALSCIINPLVMILLRWIICLGCVLSNVRVKCVMLEKMREF